MKALVIANGRMDNIEFYGLEEFEREAFDLIICADGGLKKAMNLGIAPDIVIGDFDSTDEDVLQEAEESGVKMIRYPVEKDQTDTEIVLDYLLKRNYTEITMIGCLGERVDHSLGNIVLLKKLLDHKVFGKIIDDHNEIYLIDDKIEFYHRGGSNLSLMPFSDVVEGVTTVGLYYPLDNYAMKKVSTYGISNIIEEDYARVDVRKGELFVIISRD